MEILLPNQIICNEYIKYKALFFLLRKNNYKKEQRSGHWITNPKALVQNH